MFSRRLVLVSLVFLPSFASAQSRGRVRGDKEANWDEIQKGLTGGGLQLSNKDVENISPIKLLIDKRKDLKLSDSQTKQFKDLESTLKQKNESFYKTLDSLRAVLKMPTGQSTTADQDGTRTTGARAAVAETVKSIRDNYDGTLKEALALLDESQQKTANDLVEKQRTEAEEMLREKLGGRGSEAEGATRRGRPPVA